MKRLVLIALGAVLASYLGVCALLFVKQRAFIFPAPATLEPSTLDRVDVPGGTFFLLSRVEGDGPIVVRFHGNGEQVAWSETEAAFWAQHGVSFAAVEYPGYPGTTGEPSEAGCVAAGEAALQHLTGAMKLDRARLVLEGQSLGTGVALQLAARGWGRRVVLLSPYTSIADVAARAFSWVPVRLLLRDRFDSLAVASEVKVPVLVLHGTQDEVIPFELGQQLAARLPAARFTPVEGGGHNDLWVDRGLRTALAAFVKEAP